MENKGGCITCRKCEQVRINFYCGRKKLSQKQLYNTHGFCSNYEPKEQIEKPLTNEEWFCSLPTKEKAKEMCVIMADMAEANDGVWDEEMIEEWLKEVHEK